MADDNTKTFKCPECDSKVLVNTGYCVSCKKKVKSEAEDLQEATSKEIIAILGKTDWGDDNEAQMKAVQLLKGIALSDEAESNTFMKKLSDASTKIADEMLKESIDEKEEDKKDDEIVSETLLQRTNKLL